MASFTPTNQAICREQHGEAEAPSVTQLDVQCMTVVLYLYADCDLVGCRQLKSRTRPCQTCCVFVAEYTKTSSLNHLVRTKHHWSMLLSGEMPQQ